MKVFISETDRQNARRIALINIAKFYNVQDWQYKDNETLLKKIKKKNTPLYEPLLEYFRAYDAWFNFYQDIKKKEKEDHEEHELDDTERDTLSILIQKRQETLYKLQKSFDHEQFEKFKRINGLENVEGQDLSE